MAEAKVARIVKHVLGRSDDKIECAIVRGISRKYDQSKLTERLSKLTDDEKVTKLVGRVFLEIIKTDDDSGNESRKRTNLDNDQPHEKKRRKEEEEDSSEKNEHPPPDPVPAESVPQNRPTNVQDVMAQAHQLIEARKKLMSMQQQQQQQQRLQEQQRLQLQQSSARMSSSGSSSSSLLANQPSGIISRGDESARIAPGDAQAYLGRSLEKQQKLQELQARIAAKMPSLVETQQRHSMESINKTIVEAGNVTQLTHRTPSLKANIRAERREQFNKNLERSEQQIEEHVQNAEYVDPRIKARSAIRKRRGFSFHDRGTFVKVANRLRAKAKLEKLKSEIAHAAKRTGISSAVKLAMTGPKTEDDEESVPNVEWWDQVLLGETLYDSWNTVDFSQVVTNLIEHPIQLKPPGAQVEDSSYLRVYLTKKERKKLRRQTRKDMQREKQEKIRIGLEPPPEPKVKISNLMRVLGNEAIQDPTKMEAHVREQMAKRLQKHEEMNAARKLTPEERKAKKVKKLKEDTSVTGVHVAVYRILELSSAAKKFKVETNARQRYLTGTVVIHKDVNVVVVEGGPKQQKAFKDLMLRRIKWEDDNVSDRIKEIKGDVRNRCDLVWEGQVKDRCFGDLQFKTCPLEKLAREHFRNHNAENYWDFAYSNSVLEQTVEDPVL